MTAKDQDQLHWSLNFDEERAVISLVLACQLGRGLVMEIFHHGMSQELHWRSPCCSKIAAYGRGGGVAEEFLMCSACQTVIEISTPGIQDRGFRALLVSKDKSLLESWLGWAGVEPLEASVLAYDVGQMLDFAQQAYLTVLMNMERGGVDEAVQKLTGLMPVMPKVLF